MDFPTEPLSLNESNSSPFIFRPLRPLQGASLLEQASSLLDSAFQAPRGSHFFDDFPVWERLSESQGCLRLGAFDSSGGLIATAGGRLARLHTASGTIPIGIIGMVATLPRFQGKGLASRLVASLVEWLRGQGATLVVLWGSEHRFYRRLGFSVCGKQSVISLSALQLPESSSHGAEESGEGWRPEIFDALLLRKTGLALSEADRCWVEAHRNVKWFWSRSKIGLSAYAAVGRGIDLGGMVHEWGGNRDALRSLLSQVAKKCRGASLLGSPEALASFSMPGDGTPELQALCLARVFAAGPADEKNQTPEQEALLAERFFGGTLAPPLWFWGLDSA